MNHPPYKKPSGWSAIGLTILAVFVVGGCCGATGTDTPEEAVSLPLKGIRWNLTTLGEEPVTGIDEKERPHFIIQADSNEVTGFAGCNRFFGTCESGEKTIGFGPMGSTRMMCPESADLETRFFHVLDLADTYRISGNTLELYAAEKKLARFNAKP